MSSVIADPRVTQYWDEARVVSEWYKARVDPNRSFVLYDVYFLYDENASWEPVPTEWGGTIFGERVALESALAPLLTP